MPKKKKDLTLIQVQTLFAEEKLLGEYTNIPEQVYHDGPGFSRSDLGHLLRSPQHWEQSIKNKKKGKKLPAALVFGTAFHACILEPKKFKEDYIQLKEGMTNNSTHTKWKEWVAENGGDKKIVLSHTDYNQCLNMAKAFKQHGIGAKFLDGSQKEVTYYWKDKETGHLLKARLDIVHPELGVMDIKSTKDNAMRSEFMYTCKNYNYDLQAAHYWYGAAVAMGRDYPFFFGVVEKDAPHGVMVHKVNDAFIDIGLEIQAVLLKRLDDFLNERIASGYPEKIVDLGPSFGAMDLDTRLNKEQS